MGISISGGPGSEGLDEEALRKFLESDEYNRLGGENVGIIFHREPGETLEGEEVDEEYWIEFYAEGGTFHFSTEEEQ